MSFPTAFEHWTLLALLRSQAAIADVAADPPPFEDQSDPIEFFRTATLDQQHVAWMQQLAQRFRRVARSVAGLGDRRPGMPRRAPTTLGRSRD